jgi:hypothetical protein
MPVTFLTDLARTSDANQIDAAGTLAALFMLAAGRALPGFYKR